MGKRCFFFVSCLLAGLACVAAYRTIGVSIDSDGFLNETFFLIPIGYAFFFVGIIGLLFLAVKSLWCFGTSFRR